MMKLMTRKGWRLVWGWELPLGVIRPEAIDPLGLDPGLIERLAGGRPGPDLTGGSPEVPACVEHTGACEWAGIWLPFRVTLSTPPVEPNG